MFWSSFIKYDVPMSASKRIGPSPCVTLRMIWALQSVRPDAGSTRLLQKLCMIPNRGRRGAITFFCTTCWYHSTRCTSSMNQRASWKKSMGESRAHGNWYVVFNPTLLDAHMSSHEYVSPLYSTWEDQVGKQDVSEMN